MIRPSTGTPEWHSVEHRELFEQLTWTAKAEVWERRDWHLLHDVTCDRGDCQLHLTPLSQSSTVHLTWRQVLGSPLRSWQNLRVCQLCARVSSWIDMHKNSQWLSVQFVNSDNWCLCVWSDVQVQTSAFLFSFLVGLVGVELLICFVVFPGLFVGCCCCFLRLFYQLFNHHHHHHPNPPLLAPALRLVQFLSSIIGI